ncbi:MAG TPA: thiamine-phosphate kinase [Acidimicrobiales bacterium]|nr:thiamine-phosphate kinase [Acidimicrobiales bacterium]
MGPGSPARGELFVGDDAAILRPLVGQVVVSTDVAVAGVHLDLSLFSLSDLGYKAVAAALSDLAAMGALARALVLAVTAPPGTDLEALHEGVAEAAAAARCPVVGGDLSRGGELAVAVTVIGECPGAGAVRRSGARAGDRLYVTGPLGRSAAGLRRRRAGAGLDDVLVRAHRRPRPLLAEGRAARGAGAHAMMDLSDGLGIDLHRLADASGVGFALATVPVAEGATLEEAISGGEDYELLVATPDARRLAEVFAARGLPAPIEVGAVVADARTRTLGGRPLERRGFEHRL